MPLSSVVGAQSIVKPGVCTSSTRPASPFEGQVIFETDTDRLYVYNGSAWVIPNSPAQNPQGLEIVASGSLTSTGTNISSCFSSTYDNYRIILTFSVPPQNLYFRMRTSSDDTGSVYQYGRYYHRLDSASSGVVGAVADTKMIVGAFNTSFAAGASFDIISPNLARYTTVSSQPSSEYGTALTNAFVGWTSGIVLTTTQYTGITIYPNTGTFTGEYRVYGYRNS
jgi:hypothetical protein